MTGIPEDLCAEIEDRIKTGLKEFLCSEGHHNWQPAAFKFKTSCEGSWQTKKCVWCGAVEGVDDPSQLGEEVAPTVVKLVPR